MLIKLTNRLKGTIIKKVEKIEKVDIKELDISIYVFKSLKRIKSQFIGNIYKNNIR